MMTRLLLLCLPLLFAVPLSLAKASERKVVVELFTSQGCQACPPADALLARLAEEPRILVLSLHVDYWDYLGWRDRFARPEYTRRQKAYKRMFGARSLFTPQAIVQGTDSVVGSDAGALRTALLRHFNRPQVVDIELIPGEDTIEVTVAALQQPHFNDEGVLHLVTYDQPQEVHIERGENAGKTVVYTNIVRDWMKLGVWDGKEAATFTAPMPSMGRGVAVLLQDGKVGPILDAAVLEP